MKTYIIYVGPDHGRTVKVADFFRKRGFDLWDPKLVMKDFTEPHADSGTIEERAKANARAAAEMLILDRHMEGVQYIVIAEVSGIGFDDVAERDMHQTFFGIIPIDRHGKMRTPLVAGMKDLNPEVKEKALYKLLEAVESAACCEFIRAAS